LIRSYLVTTLAGGRGAYYPYAPTQEKIVMSAGIA